MNNDTALNVFAAGCKVIPYKPELLQVTNNSITGALLLTQIAYWDSVKGGRFYKFGRPSPSHNKYVTGDSWLEELGFTQKMLATALRSIGAFKLGKKNKQKYSEEEYQEKINEAVVVYYTDQDRVTWYELKHENMNKLLEGVYARKQGVKRPKSKTPKGNLTTEDAKKEFTCSTENTREYPQDTPISPPPPPVGDREGEKLSPPNNVEQATHPDQNEQLVSPETEFVVKFDSNDFWKTIDDIRKNKALKTRFERVDHTRTRTGLSTLLSLRLGTNTLTTSELLPIWAVLRAGPSKFNILKLKIEILTRMLSDNYYQEDSVSELLAAWYLEKLNYPDGITSDTAYISYLLERLASVYDTCLATHPTIEKFLEVHTDKL